MPLPYDYFVKTSRINRNPSDSNDGKDPLGCNLSGASYDHTGGASGERQVTAASGTPFIAVQAGDYIYLTDTGSGLSDGLYEIQTVVSSTVILLYPDDGLFGDSASGIASSDGPWLTLQYAIDTMSTTGDHLVICADGGGTDDAWALTGATIDLDINTGGALGLHYLGANSRGVVDGTQAVIDGSGMSAATDMFTTTTKNIYFWYDIRFTGAVQAAFYAPTGGRAFCFHRCRFDNCGTSAVKARYSHQWSFSDCQFDNNTEYAFDYPTQTNYYGGAKLYRCRIHDNGSGGIRSRAPVIMFNCLVYGNSGDGIAIEQIPTSNDTQTTISSSVIFGNTGDGFALSVSMAAGPPHEFSNTVIAGNGGYGLSGSGGGGYMAAMRGCLLHDNTSGAWDSLVFPLGFQHSRGTPEGDDNLWIEFTGGDYDDTGHADGDYRLESTGAFADLPFNRTALINLTDSGNITAGLYTIATKISDDVVLLSKSAGSDSTGNVTADNDPGFTNETDGSENFRPLQNVLATKIGLEVEVR